MTRYAVRYPNLPEYKGLDQYILPAGGLPKAHRRGSGRPALFDSVGAAMKAAAAFTEPPPGCGPPVAVPVECDPDPPVRQAGRKPGEGLVVYGVVDPDGLVRCLSPTSAHDAWDQFFSWPPREASRSRPPFSEAVRAYEAIGYRVAEFTLAETADRDAVARVARLADALESCSRDDALDDETAGYNRGLAEAAALVREALAGKGV